MNMNESDNKPQKPVFLYVIIGVLLLAVAALGTLTFASLNHLASLQKKVGELQASVEDISQSSATLSQETEELKKLLEKGKELEQTANTEEASAPEETPSEEGTISPSHGNSSFTENTDESMDNLLSQINQLLPRDNGAWSVYVCNLLKDSQGAINEQPMEAASLIKLFIMGAVYENYDAMTKTYGKDSLDALLEAMITVSDNDAANTLVGYLGSNDSSAGMQVVNQFCQAHGYSSTSMGRLLLQSNENGDNYTSVSDCGKFLKEIYQICNGTAKNATLTHAENMYYLLKKQTRKNKIPAAIPDGVHVANKTGELSTVENDAGIIYDTAKGIDLVVVFMSQGLSDTGAAQSSIAQNSRLIYGYYNE